MDDSMNVEEALKIADQAIFERTGKHLTDVQQSIFEGSWNKQTYDEIAKTISYTGQHFKNEGAEFWKLLSEALGEKVTKSNFKAAIERRGQQPKPELVKPKSNIEALVEEVRQKIRPIIQERHGKMKVLDMNHPIEIGEIYTNVNILESITGRKRLKISEFAQKFDPEAEDFERIGFGKVAEAGVRGEEAVKRYSKLMVLGKPGAGKTTFLRYLAIQAIEGKLKPERVPIFVTLREFVDSKYKTNLLKFIVQYYSLSESEIIELLQQGRILLLLDGLDEVKEEDFDTLLKEINNFIGKFYFSEVYKTDSSKYPHVKFEELCSQFPNKIYSNSFVITCRIAAKDYTLDNFVDVEVADFNETQIQEFVQKWFKVKDADNDAEFFIEQINANPPVKELATSPLLLTLLCLEFEDSGDFPTDRAELYKRATYTLLKKWDSKRRIVREQVYKNLSVSRKEDLLSEIAWKTFERKEYFFKQRDLERYIAEYIRNLPDAKNDPEALQLDSEAVLKSIEAQHGLLVERARGIYSFSHLTFQEYFAATKVVRSCNPYSMEDQILNSLASHITELRWREVFFLVVGMLPNAGCLVLIFKAKVDRIIANDHKLQNVLADINKKSLSVPTQYTPVFIRALGFERGFKSVVQSILLSRIFLDINNINSSFFRFIDYVDNDLQGEFFLLSNFFDVNFGTLESALLLHEFRFKEGEFVGLQWKELLEDLPLWSAKDMAEKNSNFNKMKSELKKLEIAGLKRTQVNTSQKAAIRQYYESNKFLIECLISGCYVSPEVREEIEETLLLPIDEIENWKQQHRPNS